VLRVTLTRFILTIGATGVMPQTSTLTTRADRGANAGAVSNRMGKPTKYRIVHSFGKPPGGSSPWAGLINVNGTLYAQRTPAARMVEADRPENKSAAWSSA
jgi:hypothetical protein